ncbi:GntR family transcriptional regulator [Thalassobaculum fulvum]|uniref:GntR family transcriptional regulator n=1 Tax=Thalassobaculum fulvum TaxID=1633335 RepID=UPI001676D67F|nr:GntR family transcriptional regulator [Thalassobaculum fulvum]
MTSSSVSIPSEAAPPPSGEFAESGSLVEHAYQALRARAIDFAFRPGETVRVLALSKQLGLSRTPVKEALNRLVTEGLFEAAPHGFVARSPDVDEIVDLCELRSVLETAGFRLACARADDAGIAALADWWSTVSPGYADLSVSETTRVDEAFHERFVAMAGNREMIRQLRLVCARLRFFRTIDLDRPDFRVPYYDDHLAIIDALRRRDAEAGTAVIGRHIAISRERAVEMIKEALARIFARKPAAPAR